MVVHLGHVLTGHKDGRLLVSHSCLFADKHGILVVVVPSNSFGDSVECADASATTVFRRDWQFWNPMTWIGREVLLAELSCHEKAITAMVSFNHVLITGSADMTIKVPLSALPDRSLGYFEAQRERFKLRCYQQ